MKREKKPYTLKCSVTTRIFTFSFWSIFETSMSGFGLNNRSSSAPPVISSFLAVSDGAVASFRSFSIWYWSFLSIGRICPKKQYYWTNFPTQKCQFETIAFTFSRNIRISIIWAITGWFWTDFPFALRRI